MKRAFALLAIALLAPFASHSYPIDVAKCPAKIAPETRIKFVRYPVQMTSGKFFVEINFPDLAKVTCTSGWITEESGRPVSYYANYRFAPGNPAIVKIKTANGKIIFKGMKDEVQTSWFEGKPSVQPDIAKVRFDEPLGLADLFILGVSREYEGSEPYLQVFAGGGNSLFIENPSVFQYWP